MRNSVDIPDALLEEARRVAVEEATTLRALVEEGLRWAVSQRTRAADFRLPDRSVPGAGLQPGIREGAWGDLRNLIYEGRGA